MSINVLNVLLVHLVAKADIHGYVLIILLKMVELIVKATGHIYQMIAMQQKRNLKKLHRF